MFLFFMPCGILVTTSELRATPLENFYKIFKRSVPLLFRSAVSTLVILRSTMWQKENHLCY